MRDDHRSLAGLISGLSLKIITGKTRLIERHCSRLRKRSRAGKAQALRLGRKDPWRSDRRDDLGRVFRRPFLSRYARYRRRVEAPNMASDSFSIIFQREMACLEYVERDML